MRPCPYQGAQQAITLLLAALVFITLAATAADEGLQHAVCSLELQGGFEPNRPPTSVKLHCNSNRPVTIAVDTRYVSKRVARFAGVRVVGNLECQTAARGYDTTDQGERLPLRALIYFCGSYSITLQRPVVRDITLQNDSPTQETALLAFGSQIRADIHEGTFSGNKAGSCVFAFQSANVSVGKGTIFQHNKGKYGAAAMAADEARLEINDTTMQHNHATRGGAVFCADDATVHIHSSKLVANVAEFSGGAVEVECSKQVSVTDCSFESNRADYGGGLRLCDSFKLFIAASRFTNNKATGSGAAMYLDPGSQARVTSSNFSNNNASYGGGIYCEDCTVQLSNTALDGNAAEHGAAIYAQHTAHVKVDQSILRNSTAVAGAAVYLDMDATFATSNSIFVWNQASWLGGAIYLGPGSEAQVTSSSFSSNNATWGGGLYCEECTLQLSNAALDNNLAVENGGAIYAENTAHVKINHSILRSSTAAQGAAVYLDRDARLATFNNTIVWNHASWFGGAIYLGPGSEAQVTSSNFSSNNATWGGGLYCEDCTLQLSKTALDDNLAENGGAIYAEYTAHVEINHSTLRRNTAVRGAAVYLGSDAQLATFNSIFIQNNATDGAGLYGYHAAAIRVNESSFINNTASWGAALCYYLEIVTLESPLRRLAQFQAGSSHNNSSFTPYASIKQIILQDTFITSNTASISGGGLDIHVHISSEGSNDGFPLHCRVINSRIIGNTATQEGGGLYLLGFMKVTIEDSQLRNNEASGNGGAVYTGQDAKVHLNNSLLADNYAGDMGGGLASFDRSFVNLHNTLVTKNTAVNYGGGIYSQNSAVLQLAKNVWVRDNEALDGWGGGFSLWSKNFNIMEVKRAAQNNTAVYDSNINSAATRLVLLGPSHIRGYVNRVGNDEGLLHIKVQLKGYHDLPCQGVFIQAQLDGRVFMALNQTDDNGTVYLSFKVVKPPGIYNISISAQDVWSWDVPAANITLEIRGCGRGEVTPNPNTCQRCLQGYYSLDAQQAVCNMCPINANCTGGDAILPLPGFWRSSANSTQVHRCPNPSACHANDTELMVCASDPACGLEPTYKDLQCSPGYSGNLCGVCVAGTGATRAFHCHQCMRSEHIIILYAVATMLLLCVIKLMCWLTLRQPACPTTSSGTQSTGSGTSSIVPAAELFRPLVLYSQYMLIVSSMDVPWPVSISYPFRVLAWLWSPASPETFSIACVLSRNSMVPLAIQVVLFYIGMPMVLLLVLAGIESLSLSFKHAGRLTNNLNLHDRILSSSLVAVFFFMPSVVRSLLGMFACVPIDQPAAAPYTPAAIGSYWILDTNQQCFTGYHRAWSFGLGLPLIVIVCLGIPLGVLLVISHNSERLQDEEFMQQYGFLYKSYRQRYCCWEVVVQLQTMLLVAIGVFGVNIGAFYQCIVMTGALTLMLSLLLACRPQEYSQARQVSIQALCCLDITSYIALTFLQYGSVKPNEVYGIVMGVIVLLVNVAFVASVVWQLAMLVDWKAVMVVTQQVTAWCGKAATCEGRLHGIRFLPRSSPEVAGAQQTKNNRGTAACQV